MVAMQWHVISLSGADASALGLLYFLMLAPLLVLSPVAGWVADRWNRARVLTGACAALALVAATGASALTVEPELSFPLTATLASSLGAVLVFSGTASQALVPAMLPLDQWRSGVALSAAGNNLARIGGPALAAPLLVTGGPAACLWVYAGLSSLAAVLSVGLWRQAPSVDRGLISTRRSLSGGLSYAWRHPAVALALVMVATAAMLGSAYVSTLPVYAVHVLGGSEHTLSALLAFSGLGALAGSLLGARFDTHASLPGMAVRSMCMATAIAAFAIARNSWTSCAIVALVAALNISTMNALNVSVQQMVDEAHRGRVMSLFILAWGGMLPIGGLLLGVVGADLGVAEALLLSAAALFSISALSWWIAQRLGPDAAQRVSAWPG
jgi:predicted MFS family arabinose efflux permease